MLKLGKLRKYCPRVLRTKSLFGDQSVLSEILHASLFYHEYITSKRKFKIQIWRQGMTF